MKKHLRLFSILIGLLLVFSGLWFLGEYLTRSYAPWWTVLFPCGVLLLYLPTFLSSSNYKEGTK